MWCDLKFLHEDLYDLLWTPAALLFCSLEAAWSVVMKSSKHPACSLMFSIVPHARSVTWSISLHRGFRSDGSEEWHRRGKVSVLFWFLCRMDNHMCFIVSPLACSWGQVLWVDTWLEKRPRVSRVSTTALDWGMKTEKLSKLISFLNQKHWLIYTNSLLLLHNIWFTRSNCNIGVKQTRCTQDNPMWRRFCCVLQESRRGPSAPSVKMTGLWGRPSHSSTCSVHCSPSLWLSSDTKVSHDPVNATFFLFRSSIFKCCRGRCCSVRVPQCCFKKSLSYSTRHSFLKSLISIISIVHFI